MAEKLAKLPPVGTVPWHQHYVRQWTRNIWCGYLLVSVQSFFLLLLADRWYLRLLWVPQLVLGGMLLQRNLDQRREHQRSAWAAETQGTLEAMSESGLFDIVEAIEATRDGPVPPGVKRDDWLEMHNDLIKKIQDGTISDGN